MKRLTILIIAGLLVCAFGATAWAKGDDPAGTLFGKAQKLMRDKDYPATIEICEELLATYRDDPRRDVYLYALARAHYFSGNFSQARKSLTALRAESPASTLLPASYYLEANCVYRLAREEDAFLLYLKAYETATDSRLKELSRKALFAAIDAGYFPPDSILHQVPTDIQCPIKGRMARLVTAKRSREQIEAFLAGCPEDLSDLDAIATPGGEHLSLGIMLPLSGSYARYGQAILDGAMLAMEELKAAQTPVELLAYDSRADHVAAAREVQALAENGVDLIIGPLLSDVAATAAATANCLRMPLLVPVASQAGFADLTPYCFQMSPNLVTIGRGMAQYAVTRRGLTRLAVITAASVDELTMADAFTAEATRLGAKIVAVEKFRLGETDFGPYIRDLKSILLKTAADSTVYVSLAGDTLSLDETPVSIDGIFIPANEDELYLLLPQLNFYQVRTICLGTDSWDTDKVLKLGEGVLGRSVFFSGKAAMRDSRNFSDFASLFTAKSGNAPDQLAALGYDAVQVAAAAFRQGKINPDYLAEFLSTLKGYEGVSGRFTFGRGRSNLELPLFTFQNGRVIPEGERLEVEEAPTTTPVDSTATEYFKFE